MDHVAQQVTLGVGLVAAVEWRRAVVGVPPRILALPEAVDVLIGEEVDELRPLAHARVLLDESRQEQVVIEPLLAVSRLEGGHAAVEHLPCGVHIGEQHLHEAVVADERLAEGVEGLPGLGGLHPVAQQRVLVVHIPHVLSRGAHGDVQARIEGHQLLDSGTHREHATRDGGAASVDVGTVAEHLGEAFHHAAGYLAVLPLAQSREVAPASLGVVDDVAQFAKHVLACRGEQCEAVGTAEHAVGYVVGLAVAEIARAVASVVADVEGLLALGSRGQCGQRAVGIDAVVAG